MSSTTNLTRQERRRLERERVKAALRQPYLERQLAAVSADPSIAPPGHVSIASVLHDDWCPKLTGGLCRCDPEITFETLPTPKDGAP